MRPRRSHNVASPSVSWISSPRPDAFEILVLAPTLEQGFELGRAVEVIFDGGLATGVDEDDLLDPSSGALLDDELDTRRIHERQHLFRDGLGRWQESRTETRHR